jgi:nitrate reductase gamma subunit
MRVIFPVAVVTALVVIGYAGGKVGSLNYLVGVIVPYAAVVVFLGGFAWRIIGWARSPVPFRIPTTCGQEKSFPWVKQDKIDNPSSTLGVIARMLLEVFAFRSLFRSTKANVDEGPRLTYKSSKWLWGVGLMFHWSFLIIFLRHFRLFIEPIPFFVNNLEFMDGFMQLYLPTFYLTDAVIVGAATYLFLRRVLVPQVKYISLASDYFPLFLILGIALSGMLMRYITKTDIVSVKEMIQGLVRLSPVVPEGAWGASFSCIYFL